MLLRDGGQHMLDESPIYVVTCIQVIFCIFVCGIACEDGSLSLQHCLILGQILYCLDILHWTDVLEVWQINLLPRIHLLRQSNIFTEICVACNLLEDFSFQIPYTGQDRVNWKDQKGIQCNLFYHYAKNVLVVWDGRIDLPGLRFAMENICSFLLSVMMIDPSKAMQSNNECRVVFKYMKNENLL